MIKTQSETKAFKTPKALCDGLMETSKKIRHPEIQKTVTDILENVQALLDDLLKAIGEPVFLDSSIQLLQQILNLLEHKEKEIEKGNADYHSKAQAQAIVRELESYLQSHPEIQTLKRVHPVSKLPSSSMESYRLWYEQQCLSTLLETPFQTLLAQIKQKNMKACVIPRSVVLCYALPDTTQADEHHLGWFEEFLDVLENHLNAAGIANTCLLFKNQSSDSLLKIVEKAEYVVLLGTESFLKASQISTSPLSQVLARIKRQLKLTEQKQEKYRVLGVLLSGEPETSFPAEYEAQIPIQNFKKYNYFKNLQGLITMLYSAPETLFKSYWDDCLKVGGEYAFILEEKLDITVVQERIEKDHLEKKEHEAQHQALSREVLFALAQKQEGKIQSQFQEESLSFIDPPSRGATPFKTNRAMKAPVLSTQRHFLAEPLAKVYQSLAWIRLPVFQKPQPLCTSYVHLMLIDQNSNTAQPQPSNQTVVEASESLSTPWLNRYRSYEDLYRIQKAIPPETLCQSASRAVVVGRAGVGKSTFCRNGLYRWSLHFLKDEQEAAQGLTPWWSSYDFVFWIPLRVLLSYQPKDVKKEIQDKDLAKLILYVLKSQPDISEEDGASITLDALRHVFENKNLNILYLLDGFDEVERLPPKSYGARFLKYMLRKRNYVLTTRPHALKRVLDYQSSKTSYYELMGFANDDIPHYVTQTFKLNQRPSAEAEQVLHCLETNITAWTVAHTPIQLALLCALWKDTLIPRQENITMTQLYTILVEGVLRYNVQQLLFSSPLEEDEREEHWESYQQTSTLKALLEPLYSVLSKLAFFSLMQHTIVLSEDLLLEQLGHEDVKALQDLLIKLGYPVEMASREEPAASLLPWLGRFGILQAVSQGKQKAFEFIHLTFHEYFAALYLTRKLVAKEVFRFQVEANTPYIPNKLQNAMFSASESYH